MGTLWDKISPEMAKRGLTKADVARLAGVSPGTVQKWEAGGFISLASALKLEDALGIPAEQLLPNPKAGYPEIKTLLNRGKKAYEVHETDSQVFRYPADCDFGKRLDDQQKMLELMRAQLETLTQLLGATLAASSQPVSAKEKKAG